MKTTEELNALKEEVEILNKKLAELSKEELDQVAGGIWPPPGTKGSPLVPGWRSVLQDTPQRNKSLRDL